MDVLKFTLSGNTAFFKKPDVNTYYYFTYGNIHKVALLGILGSILGFGGYNQQIQTKEDYPEFYKKLEKVKVGIVPKSEYGYFTKKVQVFNNSVGYASKEKGGNLIVKEQWLENVIWDIYVLISGDMEKEISNALLNNSFKYIPYLGKNDHMANITNVEIISNVDKNKNPQKLNSLFYKNLFEFVEEEFDIMSDDDIEIIYKYEEMLPVKLEKESNKYILENFAYTNSKVENIRESCVYNCNGQQIFFF